MTLEDILMSEDVVSSIESNLDELVKLIPEIEPMFNFDQKNKHHHLNLWQHTLCALSYSPKMFVVRLSLLLHDIGKLTCYTEVDGYRHYFGHPIASEEIAKTIFDRLGLEESIINEVLYLIRYHDEPITKKDILKDHFISYERYIIQECDTKAHIPDELEKRLIYINKTRKLLFSNDKNR